MITGFSLHNVATYKNKEEVTSLKKLNFFYGTNGSGKTTISRLLANPSNIEFSGCSVDNVKGYKCYVYNQDFIDTHFYQNDYLNGVFTLGDDAKNAEIEINRLRVEINNKEKEMELKKKLYDDDLEGSLASQLKEERFNKVALIWESKKSLEEKSGLVRNLLTGFNSSKDAFFEEVLRRTLSFNEEVVGFEKLMEKAAIVLNDNRQEKTEISEIRLDELVKFSPINELSEIIVSTNTNNQISEMITKLNHSAWFEKGLELLNQNKNNCPLCNRWIDTELHSLINSCFDQTYRDKKEKIYIFREKYKENTEILISVLKNRIDQFDGGFEISSLAKILDIIELTLKDNIRLIERKLDYTNEIIELNKFSDNIKEFNQYVEKYNKSIRVYNEIILNSKREKSKIIEQLWGLVVYGVSSEIHNFIKVKENLESNILEAKAEVKNLTESIKMLKLEQSEWARKGTSTDSSYIEINKLLKDFGFNGFSLHKLDGNGHYQIRREDGSIAKKTLSEGEKTFITFLYFYYLIQGRDTAENVSAHKIIVLDDPISSLDSDVLFIVSTLIKGLYQKIISDSGNLKQLMLLTHNVHFFIELTKLSYKWFNSNVNYHLVRKNSGVTSIVHKFENPIKSSYESLWSELQYFKDCRLHGIQNCMRRILETYFTHWGYSKDLAALIDRFTGNEKLVFKSLVNWTNSGSHQILDSFYVVDLEHETEIYLEIFRRIFVETDQIGHYNMMMRIEASEAAQSLISL